MAPSSIVTMRTVHTQQISCWSSTGLLVSIVTDLSHTPCRYLNFNWNMRSNIWQPTTMGSIRWSITTLSHLDRVWSPTAGNAECGERADRLDRCLDHCMGEIAKHTVFPSNRAVTFCALTAVSEDPRPWFWYQLNGLDERSPYIPHMPPLKLWFLKSAIFKVPILYLLNVMCAKHGKVMSSSFPQYECYWLCLRLICKLSWSLSRLNVSIFPNC